MQDTQWYWVSAGRAIGATAAVVTVSVVAAVAVDAAGQQNNEREERASDVSAPAVPDQKVGTAGGERAGKDFTKRGKQQVIDENQVAHGGQVVCEECGIVTVPSQKSQSGVTPPPNEAQVDHVKAKSKGGDGSPSNGQVLCRACNRDKSNKDPSAPQLPSGPQ